MNNVEKQFVKCFIATISDTRTTDTDKSGQLIKQLLEREQHEVVGHQIIKDDKVLIGQMIDEISGRNDVEIILFTGGTGISTRDVTIEVVENKLTKKIPGFGELFRMLSFTEDIGSAAMMSRAVAGVLSSGQLIFSMPGSSGAVKLAMNKLILPEVSHMIYELRKQK